MASKVKPERRPEVVNSVYAGQFEWWHPRIKWKQLPLKILCVVLKGHLDAKNFTSCIHHCKVPKCTIHIHANGKFQICGVLSLYNAIEAIHLSMLQILNTTKIVLHISSLKLCNIVVAFATGFPIDKEAFKNDHHDTTQDSKLFGGIPYKPNFPHSDQPCFVIHQSGAVHISDSSHERAMNNIQTFLPKIREYEFEKGARSMHYHEDMKQYNMKYLTTLSTTTTTTTPVTIKRQRIGS